VALGILQVQCAYFNTSLGRYEQASTLMQRGLAMLRSTTDRVALADSLTLFAYLQYRTGALQEASRSAQESLELNRALDNSIGIAYSLIILSHIHLERGENEQAYASSNESLAICRDLLGDPHGTADSLIPLSRAAEKTGRYSQAKRWAQEGLEISRATNDRWGAGQTLRQLGLIHIELGEAQEAAELLSQSVCQFREAGDRPLGTDAASTWRGWNVSGSPSKSVHTLQEAFRGRRDTPATAWRAHGRSPERAEQGRKERALELATLCWKH
jgi:tetratricopeptide (TPR) repeat protein